MCPSGICPPVGPHQVCPVLTLPVLVVTHGCALRTCACLLRSCCRAPSEPASSAVLTPFTERVFQTDDPLGWTDTPTLVVPTCFCKGFCGPNMLRATYLEGPFLPPSSSMGELCTCMRNLLRISLMPQKTCNGQMAPRSRIFFAGDKALMEGRPHFAVAPALLEATYL